MDYRIEWSPEATEDIEAIAEFISRDSEFYARAVVSKILSVSRTLAYFPHIGRAVPELGDENIRERFCVQLSTWVSQRTGKILVVAVVY